MSYLTDVLTEETPQSEPLNERQVANSAGGYSFEVGPFERLRRFLILGSEGGTYYIGQRDLTKESIKTIEECIRTDARRTLDEIVAISEAGRAPKNDPALFALAAVVAKADDATKALALDALPRVARIGTHLFQFAGFLEAFGSLTGRAKRRALARWYTEKDVSQAAYQAIKYRQREGWTHRDILRIAHPAARVSAGNPTVNVTPEHQSLFQWIARGKADGPLPEVVYGFEEVQAAKTPKAAAELIRTYRLPREAVPTQFLTSPEVWEALLDAGMPVTALVRNLGNMTKIGLLTGTSDATQQVLATLKNEDAIRKSRIHPLGVLLAAVTYGGGQGYRGGGEWTPVQKIVDALDKAFYTSFGNVEPTGKKTMLAIDVSGSMSWSFVTGGQLNCATAAAAMALVTESVEDRVEIYGFSTTFSSLPISSGMRLDTVVDKMTGRAFGGTDCSLPMTFAQKKGMDIDTFVVYTDSETWAGGIHPSKALVNYRKAVNPEARLVVVGMEGNRFTIADPKDPGMLDVVGFDAGAPEIISNFSRGLI